MKLAYFPIGKKKQGVNVYLSHDESFPELIQELNKKYRVFVYKSGEQEIENVLANFVKS